MKLHSLFRSITFWSGILTMIFMVWVWRDSARFSSHVIATPYTAASARGYVTLRKVAYPSILKVERSQVESPSSLETILSLPPIFARGTGVPYQVGSPELSRVERMAYDAKYGPLGTWLLGIPHWLLLLGVVLAWLGLLMWRLRRYRRPQRSLSE